MLGAQEMDRSAAREIPVVALGASAGGLQALETFFTHMPADAGMAFIIVQHLAPDHETALPQLLGRRTSMPVELARDNMPIAPNRVYVIPPNATLTVKNSLFHVAVPVEARGHRMPIDKLFRSLAEERGDNAVCVILSGTGTDGTLGLRAIKEFGGMALAQAMESAQYDAMLRSAIGTGLVDHVLEVEEMPAKLLEYAAFLTFTESKSNSRREEILTQIGKIHSLLLRRAGHDFSQYKESTIARRLERRMKALQMETVEQYVQALERRPEEADRLFNDLLIGVTQFFRNPEAFDALQGQVIPLLFEGKGGNNRVRACVVGCATGEEAYSIAMLLSEHARSLKTPPRIQVFATDIDERSLETARRGRYPESIDEHIAPERLERFFIRQEGAYQVKRELRESVVFSNHSFIKDPPFSRLDLISCRNVMIYLGPELQQRILPIFHYALSPGGYLFLGPSENVTSHRELFGVVDKKHRIFRRQERLQRIPVGFPLGGDVSRLKPPIARQQSGVPDKSLPAKLERIILERYAPACVIVKENAETVYFSGKLNRYLKYPTGSPDLNVVNMAADGMRIPLRAAFHRAVTTRDRIVQRQIPIQTDDGVIYIDLTVEPMEEIGGTNLYSILFEEVAIGDGRPQGGAPAMNASAEELIAHLEDELRCAQDNAQAMFEELESSNEELKSANEEYQSTNEELESSKEELQSYNEELQTVNAEVSRKYAELDLANSDLQNLLNSTQIATIFLDSKFRIKNFTPTAGSVFRLIPGDIGRPISDLAARFPEKGLEEDLREVLRTLVPRQRQLAATEGRYFQMRILPYRTIENRIDGTVLTFTDVTQIELAQQALRGLNEDLKQFAYAASHDLQEPLRMVTSYTQLLAKRYEGKIDAQADQFIGFAVEGAQRMETLLRGLRDYWSVSDRKEEGGVPVDCERAVKTAVINLDQLISESSAEVTYDVLPTLWAEEFPLTLLFQNLIGNAIKYGRNGEPPRVRISARKGGNAWTFSVRDNGIGIEKEFLSAVFAPFRRLHGSEYPGTGIGLAISEKIVERYGGRIWVESTYGEGSVFHFTIPVRKDEE